MNPLYCNCGCGRELKIAKVPSQQKRFINGHGRRRPLNVRFWSKVCKTDYCWLWTAGKNKQGYGSISNESGIQVAAPRVSWALHYGEISVGLSVLHKCDNPACVNPEHLFLGTQKDNNIDCYKKGRNPNAKLRSKIDDVYRLRQSGLSYQKIADLLGVAPYAIRLVISGGTYQWRD